MGACIAGNAALIPAYVLTAIRTVFLFCAFWQGAVIELIPPPTRSDPALLLEFHLQLIGDFLCGPLGYAIDFL
jgi:hypothetical protein